MDITNVVSQSARVEAPAASRWRPQEAAGDSGQSSASEAPAAAKSAGQAGQGQNDLKAAAQEIASRFDLKTEVVWDEKSDRQVVKVMSPDGKRLVCQFPSEVVLRLAERLRQGAERGLLASLV